MADVKLGVCGPNGELTEFRSSELDRDANGTPITITTCEKPIPFPLLREFRIAYHEDVCTREELQELIKSDKIQKMLELGLLVLTTNHGYDESDTLIDKISVKFEDIIGKIENVTFGDVPTEDRIHVYMSQTEPIPSNLWANVQAGVIHVRAIPYVLRCKEDPSESLLITFIITVVGRDGVIDYKGIAIDNL